MNRFHWFTPVILAMALAVSCRGKQSMASKSAAAYRDAVAKGTLIAAGGHEHGAMEQMKQMPGMEHAQMQQGAMHKMNEMPGMQHGAMAGMDHSQMQHGAMQNMPGMQHGAMSGMTHAAMPGMSGMSGMQHGAPSRQSVVVPAPSSSSGIARLSPKSTLQPDDFDRPAPAAVEEASKERQPKPPMENEQP